MPRTPPALIAFQGEAGAYSDLACRSAYPRMRTLPCASFDEAFAAVQKGRARLAMIPIENSTAGRVADAHHLMPDAGLHIVGEWFQPVRHQLLAPKGATLRTIRTVQSHVQALDQCRGTTRRLGLRRVVGSDTAGSAAEIAASGDVTRAAIASSLAGKLYGLATLKANIEDDHSNTTRMLVLSRTPRMAKPGKGRVITTAPSPRRASTPTSRAIPRSARCSWRSRNCASTPATCASSASTRAIRSATGSADAPQPAVIRRMSRRGRAWSPPGHAQPRGHMARDRQACGR